MSAGPSSSVVELTTDVNSTVEHLKELAEHMRGGEYGFSQEDLRNIDEVVSALRELDAKRQKAHELLEAETITASVLRHRLATFPHKLKAELAAALSSARESNAAQIQALQSQLSEMGEQASQMERREEVLLLHNEVLEPEQRKLRAKHKELVKKVNDLMAKKARMQTGLNETKDRLKRMNVQIESLELDMLRLPEERRAWLKEFAAEKHSLLTTLTIRDKLQGAKEGEAETEQENARVSYKEQKKEKRRLSGELKKLQDEVKESKLSMDSKLQALREVEASIPRLLALEEELRGQLEAGAKKTEELEKLGNDICKETEQTRKEFATKRRETEEKIQQYKTEVELVATETKRLTGIKRSLRKDLKEAQGARDMQASSLSDVQENVTRSKRTLLFQAEEGARLEAENKELEFRLAQLLETHQVNVQLYNEEITDLKEKLAMERKTRQTVEESYTELQSQIETHKVHHARTMTELATKTSKAKKQGEQMSDKSGELQQQIDEGEQVIASLKQQLESAQSRLRLMKTSLEQEIQTLEQNIADLTEELYDRNETLKEIEPACKALEAEYEEKNTYYEKKKKEIIALKNRKAGLEDTIQRLQRQLEKMHIPQDKLRMDTLRCRAYARHSLRQQTREVGDMEEKVVAAHQQLNAINKENRRIEEACRHLEEESARLRALFESSGEMEAQLEAELRKYRESLGEQWKQNEKLEQECSSRDQVVLKDITTVKEASEERLQVISGIHDQFDQELQAFSDFIDIASRQRPKEPKNQ